MGARPEPTAPRIDPDCSPAMDFRECPSCGKRSPLDQDFCSCGEYLRWEPTGATPTSDLVRERAVGPPAPARASVPAADEPATPAERPVPPVAEPAVAPEAEQPGAVVVTLRDPRREGSAADQAGVEVEAGGRALLLAMVRNQSGIVDNYELSVRGLPDALVDDLSRTRCTWCRSAPAAPTSSRSRSTCTRRARRRPRRACGSSSSSPTRRPTRPTAATAPFVLGIQPFEQYDDQGQARARVGAAQGPLPGVGREQGQRAAAGRLRGHRARQRVPLCLRARPGARSSPARPTQTTMTVRPPKQIWIGRPHERRLEVKTLTGEQPEARGSPDDAEAACSTSPAGAPTPPRTCSASTCADPKIAKPKLNAGRRRRSGPQRREAARAEAARAQVRGPQLKQHNLRLDQLKMPRPRPGAAPGHRPAAAHAGGLPPEVVAAVVGPARPARTRRRDRRACGAPRRRTKGTQSHRQDGLRSAEDAR